MKRFVTIHLLLLPLLLGMTACSGDADEQGGEVAPKPEGSQVELRLRVMPAGSKASTRWGDSQATDDEMMNLWTVIITDGSYQVKGVYSCNPSGSDKEEDQIIQFGVTSGETYYAYSFANIGNTKLEELFGLAASTIPTPANDGTVAQMVGDLNKTIYPDNVAARQSGGNDGNGTTGATIASNIKLWLKGNGLDPTAADNGLGAKGIPMSNVQKIEILPGSVGIIKHDLIVIRMVAKIEIPVYNTSSETFKLKSVTLSGLTSNAADNLYLLPTLTQNDSKEATHGDIRPNVSGTQGEYKYEVPTDKQEISGNKPTSGGAAQTIAFYVNESATPTTNGGLFKLTVEIEDGGNQSTQDIRYALISKDGNATGYSGDWDYIARNDYRKIPLVLGSKYYRLDLVPYDFPAIGVLPSSVEELESAPNPLYQISFHDYGHFHLVPKVTEYNGTTTTDISGSFVTTEPSTSPYTATQWCLPGNNWTDAFKSYKADDRATDYVNSTGKFYETDSESYPGVDASENGGFPTMDVTTTWNGFKPYIYGKIAPHAVGTGNSVYHEFHIRVYANGESFPRELTYRFLMKLHNDHPAARRASTRSCRH